LAEAITALRQQIARIRAIPGMIERIAPEAVKAVDAELKRTIAAGESADGKKWKPTKDGQAPLKDAASAIDVEIVSHSQLGTVIAATLHGPEARHHFGWVKGGIARPILPIKGLPDAIATKITKALEREFHKTMGGA
jgi:hypothetical protein